MGMRSNEDIGMMLARALGYFDAQVLIGNTRAYTVEQVRDLLEEIMYEDKKGGANEKKEKD